MQLCSRTFGNETAKTKLHMSFDSLFVWFQFYVHMHFLQLKTKKTQVYALTRESSKMFNAVDAAKTYL